VIPSPHSGHWSDTSPASFVLIVPTSIDRSPIAIVLSRQTQTSDRRPKRIVSIEARVSHVNRNAPHNVSY
jgi:hypothetical protein